jgi:hypothetical protein
MRATLAPGGLPGAGPFHSSGSSIPNRIVGRYPGCGYAYNASDMETGETASMRTLILAYPTEIVDEASLAGKFLQLRWAGRDCLLFASADEHRYHNQILGRFLSEQGIPHRWEGAENLVVDHPELSIIGGGRFRSISCLDANENSPICAKKTGPTECAEVDSAVEVGSRREAPASARSLSRADAGARALRDRSGAARGAGSAAAGASLGVRSEGPSMRMVMQWC